MDPPIHTEYFLSGGAMILIFMVGGAKAVISFCIRSAIPGNIVVPPDKTVLAYKSLRMSTSHFMMELYVVSWIPAASIPKNDGWKSASGSRNLSFPTVMTCPSGKIETKNGMGKSVSFVDWDGVRDTITRIEHDTSCTSRSVERKYSLDGNIHSWGVESFEHDLGHLFTVSFWVEWGFSKENWVFFRCNTEFIVESVMPDLFHIVPVGDNTVL